MCLFKNWKWRICYKPMHSTAITLCAVQLMGLQINEKYIYCKVQYTFILRIEYRFAETYCDCVFILGNTWCIIPGKLWIKYFAQLFSGVHTPHQIASSLIETGERILSTLYVVLPLFANWFAACTGGMRVPFTETSHLNWYKMVCVRDLVLTISQMKFLTCLPCVANLGHLKIYCTLNTEPHCFHVYVYQCSPQTLVAICWNMGICNVFMMCPPGKIWVYLIIGGLAFRVEIYHSIEWYS